jgi:hypothetical protein
VADNGSVTVFLAAITGLMLASGIEGLMQPRPDPWSKRPWGCFFLHAGLWLAVYGLLLFLLGRPWFAMAAVSAFLLMLVLVNNAKMKALHEPFVFQDFEYFTDTIRHPRLYIPFLGWGKLLLAVIGFAVAVLVGWWLEDVPSDRLLWVGQLGGLAVVMLLAIAVLAVGNRAYLQVTFVALQDVPELGLLASLWCYGRAEQSMPSLPSPFEFLPVAEGSRTRPHLIAVQSESFFDPRPLFAGIRKDVLAEFDRLRASAIGHGKLTVPAWGANTVRTEFAFLSGIAETALGVHRFNPYRKAARSGVATLATFLKGLGYRTICIHPYPASFYARDRVFPLMGFDEFFDIDDFSDAQRSGPYIGDLAVAEKIAQILETSSEPVFVFAITMENHGPLHLEKATDKDVADLYDQAPPAGCEDLTIYLRHLRNADRMLAKLKATLIACTQPTGLCWFGDHVPIMSSVYDTLGTPDSPTEFLLWRNDATGCCMGRKRLAADQLAVVWMNAMGMCDGREFSDNRMSQGGAGAVFTDDGSQGA